MSKLPLGIVASILSVRIRTEVLTSQVDSGPPRTTTVSNHETLGWLAEQHVRIFCLARYAIGAAGGEEDPLSAVGKRLLLAAAH